MFSRYFDKFFQVVIFFRLVCLSLNICLWIEAKRFTVLDRWSAGIPTVKCIFFKRMWFCLQTLYYKRAKVQNLIRKPLRIYTHITWVRWKRKSFNIKYLSRVHVVWQIESIFYWNTLSSEAKTNLHQQTANTYTKSITKKKLNFTWNDIIEKISKWDQWCKK